jgi:hypothetical protein
MPSWRIHEKWAEKMGIPLDVARKVNEMIDSNYLHDLGKNKRSPIHPPIPIGRGMYAYPPKITVRTSDTLKDLLEFEYGDDPVKLHSSIKASILHHCLDGIAKYISNEGTVIEQTEKATDYAIRYAGDVASLDPNTFEEVENFIRAFADDLVHEIVTELKAKGVENTGPEPFFRLLNEVRKKMNYPGMVYIIGEGKFLEIRPAARKIYSLLKAGKRVRFYFAWSGHTRKYRYQASPIFELNGDLEEALEYLQSILEDDAV